jgi:AcrR family transcriptional regulator
MSPLRHTVSKPFATTRYHHGDLRAALISAARELLAEAGAEGVSLRAVARKAGVSQAAPYHHFEDKAALLAAAAAEGVRELNASLVAASAGLADPVQRLRALGVAYVVEAMRNPALFALAQGPDFADAGAPGELAEARRATFRLLFETIAVCMPRAGETRQREAFGAAWALVHGMAVLAIDRRLQAVLPGRDLAELAGNLVGFIDLGRGGGD